MLEIIQRQKEGNRTPGVFGHQKWPTMWWARWTMQSPGELHEREDLAVVRRLNEVERECHAPVMESGAVGHWSVP